MLFIALHGVATTYNGVILNALPSFTAMLLELALLGLFIAQRLPAK